MAGRREAILDAAVHAIAHRGVRGLRVEAIAERAGVSLGLIYYHFGDRAGLLAATFEHVHETAAAHNEAARSRGGSARERLELGLLAELDDAPHVVEYSAAWNELRASAVFEEPLRAPLRDSTRAWDDRIAELIALAQRDGAIDPAINPARAATRLTTLTEGLAARWLSGTLSADGAQSVLARAIADDLGS